MKGLCELLGAVLPKGLTFVFFFGAGLPTLFFLPFRTPASGCAGGGGGVSASLEVCGIGSFDELEGADATTSAGLADDTPVLSDFLLEVVEVVLEPLSAASNAVPGKSLFRIPFLFRVCAAM